MARVEIYRLKKDGLQEVIVTCRLLDDNTVVCEGDVRLVEHINRVGIWDRNVKPPERIFPIEGRKFLGILKDHFKSGYLTASEILNGE